MQGVPSDTRQQSSKTHSRECAVRKLGAAGRFHENRDGRWMHIRLSFAQGLRSEQRRGLFRPARGKVRIADI